jgi:thioredoxin 1
MIKSFKENLFYKNTKKAKLVQFWSTWCGCCLDTSHLNILDKKKFNLEIYRLNVDEHSFYASKYSIVVLPTYIFFKNLKPILILIGEQKSQNLLKAFNAKLAQSN